MQRRPFSFYLLCIFSVLAVLVALPRVYFLTIHKLAHMGHIASFKRLANCYFKGKGTAPDLLQAKYWYEQAALERDTKAMYRLGHIYSHAAGILRGSLKKAPPSFWDAVPLDYDKAMQWYTLAAQRGNASAQCRLGLMYRRGLGVPRDYQKAFQWYSKSAEQGVGVAQSWLGYFYSHAVGIQYLDEKISGFWDGVEKDLKKAVAWYTKAAEQGGSPACSRLGHLYSHGEDGALLWHDLFDIANKNELMQIEWYIKAYLLNQRDYLQDAGDGERFAGVGKDLQKALYWYKKSADRGNEVAQARLGYFYATGRGVPQDLGEAFELYKKSAEKGNLLGQMRLAVCYEEGEGVAQSYDKALEWYTKFAEQVVEQLFIDLKMMQVTFQKREEIRSRMQRQMADLTLETMGNIRALACARALATVEIDPADTETKILFR